jgi:spore coat polysaccharide biosynthesis protein SpsF (cytidylyltransferase family)
LVTLILKSIASEVKIEASFTADTLVIRRDNNRFRIIYLNSDWKYKEERWFLIYDANFERVTFSGSNLYAKSDGLYYK